MKISFQHVPKDKITKIIKMLDSKEVVQTIDISIKLIKSYSGFSSNYVYINLNPNKAGLFEGSF